jgi:heme-degrading monooxygenase HmoA
MGIWLGGVSQAAAAQGWGGDRIALLTGPNDGWAIAWHTVWDSENDAAEFETAAHFAVNNAGGKGSVLPGEGGTTRWVVVGSDATVLGKVAGVLGLAG